MSRSVRIDYEALREIQARSQEDGAEHELADDFERNPHK